MALTEDQIHYMREVLGVERVMIPFVTVYEGEPAGFPKAGHEGDAFEATFVPGEVRSEFRSSGDENAARVIILTSSAAAAFPLDGESGELTRKMIQAMKLPAQDVFIMEWNHAHTPAPLEIMQALLRTSKPVLIFGSQTARSLVGHFPKIGEWSSWEGVRFVVTESPIDLLVRPELKRVAWAHMQVFMKGLSFG